MVSDIPAWDGKTANLFFYNVSFLSLLPLAAGFWLQLVTCKYCAFILILFFRFFSSTADSGCFFSSLSAVAAAGCFVKRYCVLSVFAAIIAYELKFHP